MKIALAQINATVGDLAGNVARILDFVERARAQGAALMVTPELVLCGYPPEDLLLREDFYVDCEAALQNLASQVHGIAILIGHPHQVLGRHYNAASLLQDGRITATYHKHALPNHTVFDEQRYFDAGDEPCVFSLDQLKFGINICEDVWGKSGLLANPAVASDEGIDLSAGLEKAAAPHAAREAGAQVLLVINASPYHLRKQSLRHEVMRRRAVESGMALIYVNLVGGQDELVFDGASFAMNRRGEVVHQLPACQEALGIVTLENGELQRGEIAPPRVLEADVYEVLCLGVRDYVAKNGFPGVLLGLSGGIDSALTLAIAADALGADKVHAVMMPSQYTADMSREDARAQAVTMKVHYSEISIQTLFDAFLATLAGEFKVLPADTTEENLQSRIRGTLLMALSNKFGSMVLTTGNKSEMSTGYATLYGDMAGGFAVLKDVSKTLVYRLAAYRNTIASVIPRRVIARAPSAELRANQTDRDSLPPYDALDAIMEAYVEQGLSSDEIERSGFNRGDIDRVLQLLRSSEYKRRQAPVGIRITPRGFGKDWRYPITNKYRHN
jgi:NAD+ synthetase